MKKIFFLLIGLMLCTAGFAQISVDIYVSPSGTNPNAGNTSDANPTTLHTAVLYIDTVTVSGETNFNIWMLEGTYTGDPVQIVQRANKNLHFEAKGDAECTVKTPFKIDGAERANDAETITIKNLNFNGLNMITGVVVVSSDMTHCYPHNITVESCTFKGVDNSNNRAIFFPTSCRVFDLTLKNCSCDANSEGFLGADGGIDNVLIDNCIIKSKRGVNLQHSKNIVISNSRFELSTNKYAIRVGQSTGSPVHGTVLISNCYISGLGTEDQLIVMRGDCPDTLLLENDSLIVTGDAGVAYKLPAGVVAVVKENSTLFLNGTPNPNNERLIGVDKTSKLTVGADDLYQELKVADNDYQWDKAHETWGQADTQYVYPADVAKNMDNAVAKSIEPGTDFPVYFFSSVPDAVDFMTLNSEVNGKNGLSLDSVGIHIIKNNTLTRTITVATGKNVTLLDDKTVTSRGNVSTTLITVNQNATLTLGASDEDDTLVFDGGNMGKYFPFVSNDGTLNVAGNVIFQNNSNTNGGSAIQIKQDGKMIVNGDLVFQDNTTTGNGGAVLMNERSTLDIYGKTKFLHNIAGNNGGAISMKSSSAFTVHEGAEVDFIGNKAKLGSSIYASSGSVYLNGTVNVKKNVAENGSLYAYFGKQYISGKVTISEDTITNGALIYNVRASLKMSDGEIMNNFIKGNASDCYGVIAVIGDAKDTLVGGKIHDNVISVDNAQNLSPKPASVVLSLTEGNKRLYLGDSTMVDTINLVRKDEKNQVVWLLSNLTKVSATSPIILQVDTFDVNVFQQVPLIATNYMKFKPSSDTLAINNKGYVVRKPEISIDTVDLLQAGTKYEDYGITTKTGDITNDALYVVYTQNVDATGKSATTTADSLKINLSVTYNDGASVVLNEKLSNNINTNTAVEIPFPTTLSDRALKTGTYAITANADVYTLGLTASAEEYTQNSDIYIPTFDIDTLNFLLAGMKFSDYTYNGSCTLANTNDGAGEDIIPADEIFVGYQRSEGGNVDTAFIKVTLKDYNNVEYVYEEGTAAGQILEPGCGHFRQFTNSEKWTPALNLSDAFDGKDFTYTINIHTKTQGEPYFAVGTKTGTYHHEIDRECTIALENAEACNAMGIQFAVNTDNDTITLTYPNYFNKKAVPTDMIRDNVIKVGISFAPQDEKLTMAWFDEATDITTTDGKYIVWIPISKSISETSPIVVAENYAITPDTLRLSHTDVNGVYRKTFVVEGTYTKAIVNRANVSYHTTGASGVKFALDDGIYYKLYFDANDYTVWNVQNPTSFGKDNANVYAGLYINRPDNNVNAVYSSYRDFGADTVKPLADDLVHQLTDTAYIQYVKLGTCANQATKDYTFITKPSAAPANFTSINGRLDTVYWFVDNKFVKAERYSVNYFYAPKYTVNFNFHGGGATCNVPYSDTFADTTYVFGRPIVRPEDPFKCGNLFMDWRHGVDSFTVDSFKNIRAGIAEGTGATVEAEPFGIRSNMVIDAAWKYFVTIANPHDTAVVAHYSLCEINTRDYVWEPTEEKRPYIYTFHKDYRGKYYRDYIPGKNGNCDVEFIDDVYTESPQTLPVGQTSQVTWTVTDMCGTQFVVRQNVNVMFPPCGADNYNVDESAYVAATNNHGSLGGKYIANIDGKDYRTVRIGCNCWLKENLQNDQYANGDSIAIAKAYLDEESNVADFGRLYTWYSAVNVPEGDDFAQPTTANETITFEQTTHTYSRDYVQGICPNGWHIPALDEYQNLKDVVGAANAVKAVGSNYWLGFTDATDADHFTGIPAGYYDHSTDKYYNILGKAYFWSTDNYGVKALPCSLLYGCPEILFNEQNKFYGFSVRCVRNIKLSYE